MKRSTYLAIALVILGLALVVSSVLYACQPVSGNNLNVASAKCLPGAVNHGMVFSHPQLTLNHQGFVYDHWFEIVVRDQTSATKYLVSFSGPNAVTTTVLDGYVEDMLSHARHYFKPGESITVRIWRHSYGSTYPQFANEDFVYEASLSIPTCK